MAANPSFSGGAQIEMQRVEKSHEASYLESIQSQGYEHLGEPLQIEFNKSIDEIRNWVLVKAQNLGANLVLEVENPPVAAGQNGILVYYIWKSPTAQIPQTEPQAFACPYCTNPFMAVPGPESQVVACPNCGGANIIPAMEVPTQPEPQPEPQPQPQLQNQEPPQSTVTASTSSHPAATAVQTQVPAQTQAQTTTAPTAPPAKPAPTAAPAPQKLEPIVTEEVQIEPTAQPEPTTIEQNTYSAPEVYSTSEEYSSTTQNSYESSVESTEQTYSEDTQDYAQDQSYETQDYSQSYNQQYSTEYPSFDYFSKKVETDTNKPKAPLLTPEYEQAYNSQFASVEQAIKFSMEKLSGLLANSRNTIKFYDSGELMYPKITIRKSAYLHLSTREMDLLLIKDGVNDYKIIANESHGASGGNITPMQDELFAIKTLGHSSYRAMEDWAYLDNEQKVAVSKCIFAFTDIYFKKLPKVEAPEPKK